MLLKGNPKRACIYSIYDKSGIIDDYVIYQLKDLRVNVSYLLCVVNGWLETSGRKKLETIADDIYIRENRGFDVGAYKQAIIEYIGWSKLEGFDELVLMNDTCYGPVYPFKECFDWAAAQDVDFWGLTMGICEMHNFPSEYKEYPFAREHIQSYFLVIRRPLLCRRDHREFWESLPEITSYSDCGLYFENVFTNYFRLRGYAFNTYCDCTEYLKLHNYPMIIFPLQLILEQKCPLFKRKIFTEPYAGYISQCVVQPALEVLEYLGRKSDYSSSLIWDHLLRTQDLSAMVRNCHLTRVMPRDFALPAPDVNLSVGVVFHAYYTDLFEQTIQYLDSFPKGTEFLITTNSEKKRLRFEEKSKKSKHKFEIKVIENRGRDMSALLVGAANFVQKYDLICFAHDKKTSQEKPGSIGASWAFELAENMYGTAEYIKNIIRLFKVERQLGIAFPPYPVHGNYVGLGTGWVSDYEITKELLVKLDIDVKIHPKTLCVAPLGTNFWFRPKALNKLFNIEWNYKQFPCEPNNTDGTILHALERTFAYAAQDAGYYPAFIMNDLYARIEFTNLEIQKVGSQSMNDWLRTSQLEAIYNRPIEEVSNQKEVMHIPSNLEIIARQTDNINYGVKQSLKHLALALRYKFPRFWALMLPFRRLGQKILGIKTVKY